MKINNFLTPQVRTFVYGAVAALLSVATVQNWISDDLAKSINDNLPTILGAISSIIAAANVKQKPAATTTPSPDVVEAVIERRAEIAPVSIGVPQAAAVETSVV